MKTLKYILAVAASLAVLPLSAKDYYASTFGIKSNGTTMNTTSIQKAIDFISEEGGGKLIFKVGRYLTGTIELKDNVTIELSEGAVLVGSTNPYDYRQARSEMGLIIAYQAKNCGIIGRGVIDGQGRELANNFLGQIANGIIKDPLGLG
ncbi:MAG: glycoside hydrolase, partial [Bacteroidales bacterium]|nr:glycoside hydrolase [Candidatus Cryptobacteroides equifaecalis]